MSFDYKQLSPSLRPDSSGSFLIGLFFGFLLGLGVAAGIAIYFFKTPIPFTDKTRVPEKAPPAGQAPPEEPVTERQMREAAKQAGKPGAPKDSYFLQAGSFQNPADADNLKARLALMGMEANVEPANLAEKGVWYRVRLGPFTRIDEINRLRQQLAQNGVDASLVRIKDTSTN